MGHLAVDHAEGAVVLMAAGVELFDQVTQNFGSSASGTIKAGGWAGV
jgi:hypothetical protein